MSASGSEIEGQRLAVFCAAFFFQVLQSAHVSFGEIVYMNVIANAGPVRAWL
jgi:hypothetical protein